MRVRLSFTFVFLRKFALCFIGMFFALGILDANGNQQTFAFAYIKCIHCYVLLFIVVRQGEYLIAGKSFSGKTMELLT